MSSPDPRAHKRISLGVRNFDHAVWDRVREDAVLAGTFAKFSLAMKQHLLSTGTKRLAEASLLTSCGASVFGQTVSNPRRWPGKNFLRKALSAVRDAINTNEAELANLTSSHQLCTLTSSDEIHEISPAPPRRLIGLARVCPGLPSEFLKLFSCRAGGPQPRVFGCRVWC